MRESFYLNHHSSIYTEVSTHMANPTKPIDRIKLYEHYTFDPTIPELLRVRKPYGQSKRTTGEPVNFSVRPSGYASVCVLGKAYRRSRVLYSLCKDRIPDGYVVDHIDGNRLNDHPDNLRVCTYQENQWNADGRGGKRQNYLPKGISYYDKAGRYRASLKMGSKTYTKESHDIKELIVFLQQIRQQHHKSFAYDGWTEWTEDDQKRADKRYGVDQPVGLAATGSRGRQPLVYKCRSTGSLYRKDADGQRIEVRPEEVWTKSKQNKVSV